MDEMLEAERRTAPASRLAHTWGSTCPRCRAPAARRHARVSHDGWGEQLRRGRGQEPHGEGIEGIKTFLSFRHITKCFLFSYFLVLLFRDYRVNKRGKGSLKVKK